MAMDSLEIFVRSACHQAHDNERATDALRNVCDKCGNDRRKPNVHATFVFDNVTMCGLPLPGATVKVHGSTGFRFATCPRCRMAIADNDAADEAELRASRRFRF